MGATKASVEDVSVYSLRPELSRGITQLYNWAGGGGEQQPLADLHAPDHLGRLDPGPQRCEPAGGLAFWAPGC